MSMESGYLNRAEYVYKKIIEYKLATEIGDRSKLRSYAQKVPSYIKTNGLLATMAFINSKKVSGNNDGCAYQTIHDIIFDWMKKTTLEDELKEKDKNYFLECLIGLKSPEYRNAEREVLSLFSWIRRFAEGELGEENNEL